MQKLTSVLKQLQKMNSVQTANKKNPKPVNNYYRLYVSHLQKFFALFRSLHVVDFALSHFAFYMRSLRLHDKSTFLSLVNFSSNAYRYDTGTYDLRKRSRNRGSNVLTAST